jgi:hypothetical protein
VLDHSSVGPEPQQCDAGERLLAARSAEDRPVLDRGAVAIDDRLAEQALDE